MKDAFCAYLQGYIGFLIIGRVHQMDFYDLMADAISMEDQEIHGIQGVKTRRFYQFCQFHLG